MNTETQLPPIDHFAQKTATGVWSGCVSFNSMPDELDGERLDMAEELFADGPLDATEYVPGGGCFSAECPFFGDVYTSMMTVSREKAFS